MRWVPDPGVRRGHVGEDVVRFGAEHGWPVVIKAVRGGYDGRGVWITDDSDEAEAIVTEQLDRGVQLRSKQAVDFTRELSAMVARSPFGQGASWPVVETVQRSGSARYCWHRRAAVEGAVRRGRAVGVARGVGVGCRRLDGGRAVRDDGRHVIVNELAMRPHNSGH